MESVAVHDGGFHADDVLAVAILRLIFPNIKTIRTRDPKKLEKADIRADVGRKYDPSTGDFDHHQKEFTLKRENGIPYASGGLIWKHYGKEIINSEDGYNYIDERIVQPVDAEDNGVEIYTPKIVRPYSLRDLIESYKEKNSTDEQFVDSFEEAVVFTIGLLKRELKIAQELADAIKFIKEKIPTLTEDILVLDGFIPWKKPVIEHSKIKIVVRGIEGKQWYAEGVPVKEGSFERRKLFPEEWADKVDEELAKITGVKDATFCHKERFVACAKSKEGALQLARLALKVE